jgi:hypothetical protein
MTNYIVINIYSNTASIFTRVELVLQLLFQATAVLRQGHANAIVVAGQSVGGTYCADTDHEAQYRHEIDDAIEGVVLASAACLGRVG